MQALLNYGDDRQVIEGARQAVTLAPDYADAHRVLAGWLASTVYFGTQEGAPTEVLREARDHAERAVELDPAIDWFLIYVQIAEGDEAGARRLADLWWSEDGKNAMEWSLLAQMYGALDDAERAVQCFLRMTERCGHPDPCYGGWEETALVSSFFSERVRRDPRILNLVRQPKVPAPPSSSRP